MFKELPNDGYAFASSSWGGPSATFCDRAANSVQDGVVEASTWAHLLNWCSSRPGPRAGRNYHYLSMLGLRLKVMACRDAAAASSGARRREALNTGALLLRKQGHGHRRRGLISAPGRSRDKDGKAVGEFGASTSWSRRGARPRLPASSPKDFHMDLLRGYGARCVSSNRYCSSDRRDPNRIRFLLPPMGSEGRSSNFEQILPGRQGECRLCRSGSRMRIMILTAPRSPSLRSTAQGDGNHRAASASRTSSIASSRPSGRRQLEDSARSSASGG